MSKKFYSMLFVLVGVIMFNTVPVFAATQEKNYTNYNGVQMTEEEYNNLLNLGYTSDEIYLMSFNEFQANKDIIGKIVATNTQYIKTVDGQDHIITKEEYSLSPTGMYPGYIETTYKKLTTLIIDTNNGLYRYKVSLDWKKFPSTRSHDIIGIGIDRTVSIYSSIYFQQNYCYAGSNCGTSIVGALKRTSTGGAASFRIPTGTLDLLSSYLYFDVQKNTSSTLTEWSAYGDYAHATKTISEANSQLYSINAGGIILSSGISGYYDSMSEAVAKMTGSW